MRAFRYAQAGAASLDVATQTAIRQNSPRFRRSAFATPSIGADFRAILRNKGKAAPIVRQMHCVGFSWTGSPGVRPAHLSGAARPVSQVHNRRAYAASA